MGIFIFLGIMSIVMAGPLLWFLWTSKLKPGTTKITRIGVAGGDAELALWLSALEGQDIRTHVRSVGNRLTIDFTSTGPASEYATQHEVWVPDGDAERARHALGL